MKRRSLLVGAALRVTVTIGASIGASAGLVRPARAQSRPPYLKRDDVQSFIDAFAAAHDVQRRWLERVFAQGRYLEAVEKLMQPPIPFGSRNWLEYRTRYLDERRTREGVRFLKEQRDALARAEREYGAPPEIVTAILGVETLYGRMTGGFRTLDVLLTLTFDYLRRAEYFRTELEHFLLLAREQRIDPLSVRGSFAGAIGMPQFMPSSVRRWAVDFDGDGHIDLMRSHADSVGSIASFLAGHGWQRDEPILLETQADEKLAAELIEDVGGGIDAQTPWSMVASRGVDVDTALDLTAPVLLIDLPIVEADGTTRREYRIGTRSFSAILHYNRSYFYGAAVVELAQALRART
jgi:membrane-bound lytic murein transglycosylase B